MHTHTFTSRFAIGDKITNGFYSFIIKSVACSFDGIAEYKMENDHHVYREYELSTYHLAPKYPVGSRVWIIGNNEIREALVTNKINNVYVLEGGNYTRLENQIFPTSEDARNNLKIIPLP